MPDGPYLPNGEFTIDVKGKQYKLTANEIENFSSLFVRDQEIRSRISKLLRLDLFVCSREFGINPAAVVQEIEYLEGKGRGARGTKAESIFTRKPLAGLWHKHFFCASFMPRNIQTGLAKGRLKSIIDDAVAEIAQAVGTNDIPEVLADEISRKVAHRCVEETLTLRREQSAITGEWIIYAKHQGKNYYLSLGSHKHGDDKLRTRIEMFCLQEFPFVANILPTKDGP